MNKCLSRQRGFSMIEVMVALIVIAIALFGTAKMQALGINSSHNSAVRSIAALQAASMAAAMRANPAYWGNSSSPPPTTVASYSYSTSTNAVTQTTDSTLAYTTDCGAGVCTPQQMAAYDLSKWIASLAAALPAGGANVACAVPSSTVPETCTVEVDWIEKQVSANALTTGGAGNSLTPFTYKLIVQP